MLKKHLLLLFALLGGVGGFVLRSWQLQSAFEPYTGLPISGAPSTIAISLFSLVMAALFALLCYRGRSVDAAYHRQESNRSFLVLLVTCLAGGATAVAAFGFFQEGKLMQQIQGSSPLLTYLFALLTLGSGGALLLIAFRRYQQKTQLNSLALLLPAFSGCLWLMVSYQRLAGDPFVTDYIFQLFAIMSGMLAHYFIASHSFQTQRSTAICATSGLAIYFSLTALAYAPFTADGFLCMAQVLYFAATLWLLSRQDPSLQPMYDNSPAESTTAGEVQYHPLKEENP